MKTGSKSVLGEISNKANRYNRAVSKRLFTNATLLWSGRLEESNRRSFFRTLQLITKHRIDELADDSEQTFLLLQRLVLIANMMKSESPNECRLWQVQNVFVFELVSDSDDSFNEYMTL